MTKATTARTARAPRKPAAKKAPRATAAIAAAVDYSSVCGQLAAAVKTATDNMARHDGGMSKSAEAVEAMLASIFPKPDPEFGKRDGKNIRITGADCPEGYKLLWAAFHDGVKTLTGGKVEIVDQTKVKYRENAWSAAIARIRGEIPAFEWNLHRAKAKVARAARTPKGLDETVAESIRKLIDKIQKTEDAGKCVDVIPDLQRALARLK